MTTLVLLQLKCVIGAHDPSKRPLSLQKCDAWIVETMLSLEVSRKDIITHKKDELFQQKGSRMGDFILEEPFFGPVSTIYFSAFGLVTLI